MLDKKKISDLKSSVVAIGLKKLEDPFPLEIIGSGFLFDPAGYVMSAAHVFKKCEFLQKEYKKNGQKIAVVAYVVDLKKNLSESLFMPLQFEKISVEYLATQLKDSAAPENMDIGYGKLSRKHNYPSLEIVSETMEVSDEILLCGYPGGSQTFSLIKNKESGMRFSPVLQFGRISGFMAHDNDPIPYGLQTDIVGTEGSSGSPILNDDGQVIGLSQSVLYSYFESKDKTIKGTTKLGLVWGTSNIILSPVAKAAKHYFETGDNEPIPIPFTEYTLTNVPLPINNS